MLTYVAKGLKGSKIFGFGLTPSDFLQLKNELFLFDFRNAKIDHIYGILLYLETASREEITIQQAQREVTLFFKGHPHLTPQNTRIFLLTDRICDRLISTPFWAFNTQVPISRHDDQQIFFSGPSEKDILDYLINHGINDFSTPPRLKPILNK